MLHQKANEMKIQFDSFLCVQMHTESATHTICLFVFVCMVDIHFRTGDIVAKFDTSRGMKIGRSNEVEEER